MERKKFETKKYVLVFIFTLIIFSAGIALGLFLSSTKIDQIQQLQESFRADSLDIDVQYSLIDQDPCGFVNTGSLTQKIQDIGEKLDYMGSSLGENDTRVIQLKSYYSLLEISHWMFEKKMSANCGHNRNWILYFYSNVESECSDCNDQGFILSHLKKKYGNDIAIYSFDKNLQVDSLSMIKKLYNVNTYPAIVINDKNLSGLQTLDELENYYTIDRAVRILSQTFSREVSQDDFLSYAAKGFVQMSLRADFIFSGGLGEYSENEPPVAMAFFPDVYEVETESVLPAYYAMAGYSFLKHFPTEPIYFRFEGDRYWVCGADTPPRDGFMVFKDLDDDEDPRQLSNEDACRYKKLDGEILLPIFGEQKYYLPRDISQTFVIVITKDNLKYFIENIDGSPKKAKGRPSKLSNQQIEEIKNTHKSDPKITSGNLAKQYGVGEGVIRKNWN